MIAVELLRERQTCMSAVELRVELGLSVESLYSQLVSAEAAGMVQIVVRQQNRNGRRECRWVATKKEEA